MYRYGDGYYVAVSLVLVTYLCEPRYTSGGQGRRSSIYVYIKRRLTDHILFFHFQVRSDGASSLIDDWPSNFTEAQVFLCRDDTDSVGVSLSSTPALNTDNHISFPEDAQTNGFLNPPLESSIDIFLPVGLLEVWLVTWEHEWIYATV